MSILLLILFFLILVIVLWALLGKGEKPERRQDGDNNTLFRRRATDLEIEEEFPDRRKKPQKQGRTPGKTSAESGVGEETSEQETEDEVDAKDIKEASDDLDLPYTADEIISETSRFKIYKRTLMNAEIYAKKGDFSTAISLYEGVNSRINDTETNNKIEVNIDYLTQFREQLKIRKREKRLEKKSKAQSQKPNEIKLSIDGPLTIPETLQIGVAPLQSMAPPQIDISQIMSEIAGSIAEITSAASGRTPRDVEFKRIVQEIDYLKDDVSDLNKKVKKTAELAQQRDSESITIKDDLKSLNKSLRTLSDEKDSVTKKIDSLKSKIDESPGSGASESSKGMINGLEQDAGLLGNKIDSISGDIEKIETTSGSLKKEINKLANEIKNLNWEKDSIELDLMNLKSSFQNPASYPNVKPEILQKSIEQIDELKGVTGTLGGKINETSENITKLHADSNESKEEISRLKNEIGRLTSEKNRVQQELVTISSLAQSQSIPGQMPPSALPDISQQKQPRDMSGQAPQNVFPGAGDQGIQPGFSQPKTPELTQARFTDPGGLQAPGANMANIPMMQVPPYQPMNYPFDDKRSKQEKPGQLSRKDGSEQYNRQKTDREEELVEGDEQFELLSEYEKEELGEAEIPSDNISDDDIFEKIVKDDEKKTDKESFEIIGDNRAETEYAYDLTDEEFEKRQRDEMRFYQRFLRHNKRKKRELPILKVTYDFTRLPDEFSLSRDKNILEYSFYRYKAMLERANDFVQDRRVRDAINYYKVVMAQNIPPEFKSMIKRNINDLTEYLEKYLAAG